MIAMAKHLFGESHLTYILLTIQLFNPFVRCEHYSTWPEGTCDHLCSYEVSTGLYDLEYLEALFDHDIEETSQIENFAWDSGFGPLASCSTIWNYNTNKVHCRESLISRRIQI